MKYNFEIDMSSDNAHSLILRRINKGSRVLEFGTATGYMTRYMKEELRCSVVGVEIDPAAAEKAGTYCEKMIVTDIDSLGWAEQLKGDTFDHIVFADVLEHLRNPWNALTKAGEFLRKNGSVITSIPNIAHSAVIMEMLQGRFEYRTLGLLDNTHIRFFTRKSILDLLDTAGLYPVDWQVVVVHPENTEFGQQYNSFSNPVAEALKNRKDAHIYQYISVSRRKEDVSPGEYCADLTGQTKDHPHNKYLQVFWEEDGKFDESRSTKVPLNYDTGFEKYDILIPSSATRRLRLDPGTLAAYLEVKSISLYPVKSDGSLGQVAIQIIKENSFDGLLPGPGVVFLGCDENKLAVSTNDDPQLYLEVDTNNRSSSWLLTVVISAAEKVPVNVMDGILTKLDHLNQMLKKKDEQLEEILNSNSWKITAPLRWFTKRLRT